MIPLFGLSDPGDLWNRTLDNHLTKDSSHTSTKIDSSLLFSNSQGKLDGITGLYVDDLLRAGSIHYRNQCSAIHEKFETTGDEEPPLTFADIHVTKPSTPRLLFTKPSTFGTWKN